MKVAVIGGGSWGTALASVLAHNVEAVQIWAMEPEVVAGINQEHKNPRYQREFQLSERISATHSEAEALEGATLVCVVVPSHAMRIVMTRLAPQLRPGVLLVSASKGIENRSLMTMEEVWSEVLPRSLRADFAFLSGPSFARETLQKQPTVVTVAAHFQDVAQEVQAAFATEWFRVYTSEDVTGVELGGALKNVIAIAAGVASGLGLGHNTRAALLTRGLAEISRLAVQRGANPLTLSGLSGMGDLVLTCTGSLSRNRQVGEALGRGKQLNEILGSMGQVAEGVRTTQSAYMLSQREGVEMPITQEVYRMLYEEKAPKQALAALMGRALKAELG